MLFQCDIWSDLGEHVCDAPVVGFFEKGLSECFNIPRAARRVPHRRMSAQRAESDNLQNMF